MARRRAELFDPKLHWLTQVVASGGDRSSTDEELVLAVDIDATAASTVCAACQLLRGTAA
eukprot:CAMPEP_0113270352 /NCGR_PEP_ID=MMETSP0008_2-20120614/22197_1 /TAXON_ID=97485 /ORGANISM="Prymnesium parvum" /LENGTH=59 /DNA_ID=CAMNT_0000119647 /DNA_START=1060 /DNA_END=1236 /DNA_ORIENTATION=+ /assembly_acc=CAM_ASM_000153